MLPCGRTPPHAEAMQIYACCCKDCTSLRSMASNLRRQRDSLILGDCAVAAAAPARSLCLQLPLDGSAKAGANGAPLAAAWPRPRTLCAP